MITRIRRNDRAHWVSERMIVVCSCSVLNLFKNNTQAFVQLLPELGDRNSEATVSKGSGNKPVLSSHWLPAAVGSRNARNVDAEARLSGIPDRPVGAERDVLAVFRN